MSTTLARIEPPRGGYSEPDTATHIHRMRIPSSSSDKMHLVSQRVKDGLWECSCRGWIRHRTCHHLTDLRLPTVPKLLPGPRHIAPVKTKTKPFGADGKYGTYDTSNGFGSAAMWKQIFNARMGIGEARRVVGSGSPLKILGLKADATWKQIKSAYRTLAKQHHPDAGGRAEDFRNVQAAFECLEHQFNGGR